MRGKAVESRGSPWLVKSGPLKCPHVISSVQKHVGRKENLNKRNQVESMKGKLRQKRRWIKTFVISSRAGVSPSFWFPSSVNVHICVGVFIAMCLAVTT